ncbi:GntR family transcriptional regulator [Alicyclobacillus shizuokensis]|uniref:GntR family transcriptional regulator n=1 Tax=Alicyclobacillus shizuokensis TaxID=392014 RepID=UPI0008334CF3|nr:GntR family transcriptional regulator [Alicyclobacillus shizuokensis]MCL6626597.1 GntR family transcriptional regulator [Alicyclobacillus shizuokensis]
MGDDFRSSQPIYLQLADRICREIVRGDRKAGDKLPSVRDMAVEAGVNPNTVQRVYAELERMQVAETRRGQGTFVTEDVARLRELREELMHERIASFVRDMTEMGFRAEEIVTGVRAHMERSLDTAQGGRTE